MTEFLTREQCGMRPANTSHLYPRSDAVLGITLHTTGGPPGNDPVATWRAIQAAEMDGKLPQGVFYGDIAYNGGITLDGRALQGRDPHWVGAHALAHDNLANRLTLGIAVIGDGTILTRAAEDAIRACGYLFSLYYHRTPAWLGHRDWNAPDGSHTSCPDNAIYQFVLQLRSGK